MAPSFDSGCCSAVLQRFERFERLKQFERLVQDLLREFRRGKPYPVIFVLQVVSYPVVFFDRERVFSGVDTVLLKPFCVHIETAGRLAHDFYVELLSLFSQQPVDKDFGGIGVWCMLDDADHAGTVARRRAFFQLGKFLNRQVGGDKTLECVKADADYSMPAAAKAFLEAGPVR
jgi:hypothetical protein